MFTVRGSPQQIDYARQLVEEKIGVKHYYFIFYGYGALPYFSVDNLPCYICIIRDLSLPWVDHMAPPDHMEAQDHMAPLDHLVPLVPLWVHTTLDHTTRDLQDHSKQSGSLIKCCGMPVVYHFWFIELLFF